MIASDTMVNSAAPTNVQMRHGPDAAARYVPPHARYGHSVTTTQSATNSHASSATTGVYDNVSRPRRAEQPYNNGVMSSSYSAYGASPPAATAHDAQPQTYREIRQKIRPHTGIHSQFSQGLST